MDDHDSLHSLYQSALTQLQAGELARAEESCLRVLAHHPGSPPALHVLGLVTAAAGRLDRAEALLRQCVSADPTVADYHNSLGTVLAQSGRYGPAVASFDAALGLRADYPAALRNRAAALARLGRLPESAAAYREALRLAPDDPSLWEFLLGVLQRDWDLDGVIECRRRMVELRPRDAALHSSFLYGLHYHPGYDARALFLEHLAWAKRHAAAPTATARDNDPDPGRVLRVGYVSGDFRRHTRATFMEPVLANHDPAAVHVSCYSDVKRPDAVTARFRAYASAWRDVAGLGDEPLAAQIRADRIDVLVDLTGHMAGNRLPLFARRPAPVQVAYPGYPNTTGLSAVDYLITDADRDPPGAEQYYTEELVRLPVSSQCYRPPDDAPPVTPPPSLAAGRVTFASLHWLNKVTPAVARAWGRILAAVPGSRLLLLADAILDRRAVGRVLSDCGVDVARVDPIGRQPPEAYHRLFGRADVLLDTFPYNGHTTTLDALWMGVPVVTCAGSDHRSREGLAVLRQVGLEDCVADSPSDYVAAAASLATDARRLSAIREGLRGRMRCSPLCDGRRVARALEEAYRAMWRRWLSGPGAAAKSFG